MTATDELRRLLDERGVFWIDIPLVNMKRTCWKSDDNQDGYCYFEESDFGVTDLTVSNPTPEQVVKATLGPAARHPKPHEQWTTVLLSEIAWDRDDRWPDYLSVAHDAHGEWRVYVPEATLGRGTCHKTLDFDGTAWICSECGEHIGPRRWNFCPNCGRKVVDE